jgi:hypothetical protein
MSLTDSQQVLERLARQGPGQVSEGSVVASPGARASAWVVKVKSKVSRNVYNVRAVVIGDTGSIPVEIGSEVEAVNVAESFQTEGVLPAGSYAVMFRVGEKNVFYAKP